MLLAIGFALFLVFALAGLLGVYFAAPGYGGHVSTHFDGERFHNKNRDEKSFWDFLSWSLFRRPGKWEGNRENGQFAAPPGRVAGNHFRLTFVGHATLLLQIHNLNILTDPIWSDRCSPVSFIGPRRVRPPGVPFNKLPKIDVILISHNHYDHLDLATLKAISDRDHPLIISGLGNSQFLEKNGIHNAVDLDWWKSQEINSDVEIWGVPAQHFSGRGLSDRNKTLWMGFVVETRQAKVYFAGDTGFSPHFQEIFERFGPIDLALLPIGAFLPEWFMRHVHVSPKEAVMAAEILHARNSIGMHFGTFKLADDGEHEPIQELKQALQTYTKVQFQTLDFGEGRNFDFVPKR